MTNDGGKRPLSEPRAWKRYLRIFGASAEKQVDDELSFHLEMRVQEYVRRGLSPENARAEALRRFGDVSQVRDECRDLEHELEKSMTRAHVWSETAQDIRYAIRTLVRQPAFTIVAALTLALGIGANTAIFSVVNAFLFRPFPSPVADRLMVVAQRSRAEQLASSVSYQNFLDIRAQTQVFDDALSWSSELVNMRAHAADDGERRFVSFTSGSFFPMLALRPAAGRFYSEDENRQRTPVVVLSYGCWTERFGADPRVIGSQLTLNGIPFTIVGVAPKGFRGTQDVLDMDLFAPITSLVLLNPSRTRTLNDRTASSLRVWTVRKRGVSEAQVTAALLVLSKRIERQYPDQPPGLTFFSKSERHARPEIAISDIMPWIALVFMALTTLVLLIACVNVANLMLARATARQPEIAVRSALGASRSRLVRQLLTESIVLSLLGLVMGALIGRWVIGWIGGVQIATDLPVHFAVEADWRVAAFTAAVAMLAGIVTGLAPAFHGTRSGVASTLRESGRSGGAGAARQRLRSTLVVAQIAVSLVLLVCAGLFTRSVARVSSIDIGFRGDHLLMTGTDVSFQRYDSAKTARFYRELVDRTAALPGVTSAALSQSMPLGVNNNGLDLYFDEDVPGAEKNRSEAWYDVVSADYFPTLGLPILSGRGFSRFDSDSAPRVIVVSEAFVKKFFPGKDPLGRHVRFSKDGAPQQIVGVAKDTKHIFLSEEARPFVYRAVGQAPRGDMYVIARTRGDPAATLPAVRELFRQLDRELPVYDSRTMSQHLATGISFVFMRIAAILAGAVGILGLVQTVVGLYGVISYGVSQRTREFGIRMALGARQTDVVNGVLRQGVTLTAIGLAVGLALTFAISRYVSALLVGVSATDAVTYGGATAVLAAMSLISTYLPALRASRMEPVDALRAD